MDTNAVVRRLSAIGREEAQLMRRLARLQAERCKLLCDGVGLHGADLGLSAGVTAEVVEPKDD